MSSDRKPVEYDAAVMGRIDAFAENKALKRQRAALAKFAAKTFSTAGDALVDLTSISRNAAAIDSLIDKHGDAITVCILLRVAAQLVSASAELFADGRHYAASALLRQLVEIEYLAWAVESNNEDAKRWLRSNRKERLSFFAPAKLRQAAQGRFRGQDYHFHCEFGGHPTPTGAAMLLTRINSEQILMTDMLGHAGRIWDHLVGWAQSNRQGDPIRKRNRKMVSRFRTWKAEDPLAVLPPPPLSRT